jgi:hypothetical protein
VFASWKTGLGGVVRAWYCGVQRVSQQFISVALGANLLSVIGALWFFGKGVVCLKAGKNPVFSLRKRDFVLK